MIAPWMAYVLVVSALLAVVATMVERVAVVQGWTRRWIWAAAIVACVTLIAVSPRRRAPALTPAPLPGFTLSTNDGPTSRRLGLERAPIVRWGALGEIMDRPLRMLWIAGSVGVACLLLWGAVVLARRRRGWREETVDGVRVFVAPADGPAVIGLVRQRVVVPEWSLALDESARAMMLKHEIEHVRARDPFLTHLASLTIVALPWNLPLWWMLRRLRLAVEVDCDARVLAHTPRPAAPQASAAREYGELLLAVATRQSRHLVAAPALLEHTTALGRRIMAMNPRFPRFPRVHNTLFAAAAIAVTAWAGVRQPPTLNLTGPAASAVNVDRWNETPQFPFSLGQLRERLAMYAPDVLSATTPSIVGIVRSQSGAVRYTFRGSSVRGPLVERVASGYGHAVELLLQAQTPAEFLAADSAFFGGVVSKGLSRAGAPVREGVNATAVDVMRVEAGVLSPAPIYVFVMTLNDGARRP
jgi:hypothetical protein